MAIISGTHSYAVVNAILNGFMMKKPTSLKIHSALEVSLAVYCVRKESCSLYHKKYSHLMQRDRSLLWLGIVRLDFAEQKLE